LAYDALLGSLAVRETRVRVGQELLTAIRRREDGKSWPTGGSA
jgi:hypothetical protein